MILDHLFQTLRQRTLALLNETSPTTFCRQAHPDFSPVGWHFGHIAWTEGLWLLPPAVRKSLTPSWYDQFFAADGLPKAKRSQLPDPAEVSTYLTVIRNAVWENLKYRGWQDRAWLGWWLLQHEAQHYETIQIVLSLQAPREPIQTIPAAELSAPMTPIPPGTLLPLPRSPLFLDNEQPQIGQFIPEFEIDLHPVTRGQFQHFIQSGGYETKDYWTPEGWQWRQAQGSPQPRYWHWPQPDQAPVAGLSWYEAAAYARFVNKELPTEAQWERALEYLVPAAVHSLVTLTSEQKDVSNSLSTRENAYAFFQVWEWTDTWFHPYPGFCSSPYPGYSAAYFDQAHRVLKGGSFASNPITQRRSFRNWYQPHVQETFAGVRCVRNL